MKISDLPPTEDSNLLLSVQLETEVDPGQKSNKRKKTELYCNLLHLNDTNDMEVPVGLVLYFLSTEFHWF